MDARIRIGCGVALAIGLFLVPAALGSALSPATAGTALAPARTIHTVSSRLFPGTSRLEWTASTGTEALVVAELSNGSYERLLFDGATKTPTIVPGGINASLDPGPVVADSSVFYESVWDPATSVDSFTAITTSAKVTAPALPLSAHTRWALLDGNGTTVIASAGRELVAIDPAKLSVRATDASAVPGSVTVAAAVAVGSSVYVAGATVPRAGASAPYLAKIVLAKGKTTALLAPTPGNGSVPAATFDALDWNGSELYVGGTLTGRTAAGNGTVGGLLYAYAPASGTLTNDSALLLRSPDGVLGLAPWSSRVVAIGGGLAATSTGAPDPSELEVVTPGLATVNDSALYPKGFVVVGPGDSEETSKDLFIGGLNPAKSDGELMLAVA